MVKTIGQWMTVLLNFGLEMRRVETKYGWSKPITADHVKKESTCVGYVAGAMQEAGLLPTGLYIHMENGKLLGNGVDYIKQHPELFEILWVRATPQTLGDSLKMGDICLISWCTT